MVIIPYPAYVVKPVCGDPPFPALSIVKAFTDFSAAFLSFFRLSPIMKTVKKQRVGFYPERESHAMPFAGIACRNFTMEGCAMERTLPEKQCHVSAGMGQLDGL